MFKTNVYKEAFSHMLTSKMTTEDYSILNLANEAYPAMPSVDSKLDDTLAKYNPFRKVASIFNIEGEGSIVVTTANGIATIVDEAGALPEVSDESKEIRFSSYKIGSLAKLKLAFINDRNFNVENYLSTKFAKRFGIAEENLIVNGTGNKEPLGIMNSGIAKSTASALTYDEVVKLFFSLDKDLRVNATWMMSDEMAMKLRSVKDSNGYPLFNGERIFNKEVMIINSLDENTILFGDFSYLYILIRKPLSVRVLTEKYIATGDYGYAGIERIDAKITDINAIKALVIHTEE
jgi:HK97 family phage major capsid protein